MIRTVTLAVLLALTSSAPIASALDGGGGCCACPQSGSFALSGSGTNSTVALFCLTAITNTTLSAASQRCLDQTGGGLLCVVQLVGSNTSCREDLASEGILCPTSPAPAAGGTSLLALAVVLAAGGSLVLRRGRRRVTTQVR